MPALAQMKLLVNLAQIDGSVAEREKNYIINIGRANGFYPDQIIPMLEQRHELIIPQDLTPDKKFECIFNLVQLMKIDERMYKEEIMFCSQIATRLGYDHQVMFDLMLNVKAEPMSESEKESLKNVTAKHLKQ